MTTATILRFPSRGTAGQRRQRSRQHSTPPRKVVEVVGFDLSIRKQEDALHDVGARNDRVLRSLNLADVRLSAAQLGRYRLLGSALPLPPLRELQNTVSPSRARGYCDGLYFVNGHKQDAGAEYKQMAYVLAMHPANRLRELRKAAGLNQSELARRTGVSQPFISQVENQLATTLDIARMRVFAREFGCSPADLLADEDNPDRLSAEERELIAAFRAAGAAQRELISRVAQPVGDAAARVREAA